ncbi:MAG: MFS transporter, partial [Muribaculaceae bacterium]|nr:MFS transporter [Muribaculaceae bacterium]
MTEKRSPWWWVPSLYFAEGLPYMAVMTISTIMYKCLGIGNTELAFYTGWLYLPWVVKPFWSPFVDILRTKRWWVVAMQWTIAAAMAGIAFAIPAPGFFRLTLGVFWLMAFASATHDIAADGFYMLGLTEHRQSYFVGIRSLFYRCSMIVGQGGLVVLAAYVGRSSGSDAAGW